METAIRWSPSSTLSEQRFLVVEVNGRSFKRCKVEQYDGKNFQHSMQSTYSKVPPFRAFDWAPHDETLVAVGQWSGEATVLRIDDTSSNVSLPAKHQRLCNAVAFSRTGLMAAGLERVRNDFCLNIWDVNQRFPAVLSQGSGAAKPFVEPYRKFASSEAISSIKFYTAQPEVLVTGVKGRGVRIYDLRENTGSPSLHFQTTSVFNLAIDPLDENYFACAGAAKDTTIQIWDRRSGIPYTALTLGSGSDFGVQAEGPMVQYAEAFNTPKVSPQRRGSEGSDMSIWSLRYCKGKSGYLGALASNGDFKVFETKREYSSLKEQDKTQQHPDYDIPNTDQRSILTKRIHHIEHAHSETNNHVKPRVVAFDFTNLAGSKGTPCAIILRSDQSVDIVELSGPSPALSISWRPSLLVSRVDNTITYQGESSTEDQFLANNIRIFNPSECGTAADLLINLRKRRDTAMGNQQSDPKGSGNRDTVDSTSSSSRESHEHHVSFILPDVDKLSIAESVESSTVTRRRCIEGYLFDCKKNIGIVRDNPWLLKLWTWIDRAKDNAEDNGMITDILDLSFFGIASVWNNDLDSQRASNKLSKPTYSKEVATAVEALCARLELPEFRMTETSFPNHRRLCLHTCGLGLPHQQLEECVKKLVFEGENTKAAALAMIHDQVKLAYLALKNGKPSSVNRELAVALAGFNKGLGITDEAWNETIQDMKENLDDPYARSILALVSYGDWHDVLAETTLPLRDRVGIALLYLNDEELTQYINDNTAESIKEGDIEGIVLTGLTEQAVPLFEKYAEKFSDTQTALLAMSFTCPRYFADTRVDKWRETYRSYLNGLRLFIPRVQYDVQATKLSTPPNGKPQLAVPPRQFSLECNHCHLALDRGTANPRPEAPPPGFGTHPDKIFGDAKTGTVCPKCGKHLPRCVVCMDWLGMPDPHSRGNVAAAPTRREMMNKFISVCLTCDHMAHAGHSLDWFDKHDVCPVPDCDCECRRLDNIPQHADMTV